MTPMASPTGEAVEAVEGLRIVAPADSPGEVEALARAGAAELYCGVLPPEWAARYGDWDCLSRRQGSRANLSGIEELGQLAEAAAAAGVQAALALNVRYSAAQIPDVLELALAWERLGGRSVILSSLALLIELRERGSRLLPHVSLLANVTNSRSVSFFRRWGITRVIFPRSLSIGEMREITQRQPATEFEAMALNEKCRFIDGLCGFYHGSMFSRDTASAFAYERADDDQPIAYRNDLCYAGHGCQVPFRDERGRAVRQQHRDDVGHPACAACDLRDLNEAGVSYLKIGGRGLPTELKVRAVEFLRRAGELALGGATPSELRGHYAATFGSGCDERSCYYRGASRAR